MRCTWMRVHAWYEGICTPEPDGLMGGVIAGMDCSTYGMAGGLTNPK